MGRRSHELQACSGVGHGIYLSRITGCHLVGTWPGGEVQRRKASGQGNLYPASLSSCRCPGRGRDSPSGRASGTADIHHALTSALVGAGVAAAGFSQVKFAALGSGVVLSLLFSPIVALLLTLGVYSLVVRFGRLAGNHDCVCVDKPQAVAAVETGALASVMMTSPPSVRWAHRADQLLHSAV